MKTPDETRTNGRLDVYLDGRMTDVERTPFERRLMRDARLHEEVELQRAIDDSIGRLLRPPSAESLRQVAIAAGRDVAAGRRGTRPGAGATMRFPRWAAIAASLMLCVTGVWLTWSALGSRNASFMAYEPPPRLTMTEVYRQTLDAGFVPQVVCRDAIEFEGWFVDRFGRPLQLLDALPEGVAVIGLGYDHTISPETIHLLVEAGPRRIMVFVDARESESGFMPAPAEGGLHRFRREAGGLVLYELSPLAEPIVIPHARTAGDAGGAKPGRSRP